MTTRLLLSVQSTILRGNSRAITGTDPALVDWLVAGRFPHRTVPRQRYHNEYDDCLFFMEHSVYVGEKSCRGIVLSEESHDKIRLRNG